ncbi:MAG: c-type cytochrome [Anaerolineales bacterium]|jgi:cytochrome c2
MDRRRKASNTIQIPWGWIAAAAGVIIMLWFLLAPPRFWTNIVKHVDLSDPVATGEQLVSDYECRGCHLIGSYGGYVGPDLRGVTQRLDLEQLDTWLRDPASIVGPSAMPDFDLSNSEIKAIIAYLQAQDSP